MNRTARVKGGSLLWFIGEIRIARPERARRPGFRVKLDPTISGGKLTVCRVANRPRKWSPASRIVVISLLAAAILLLVSAPADAQGPRLFYESDGTGTPIILVPDWGHDTGSWFRILPLLRRGGPAPDPLRPARAGPIGSPRRRRLLPCCPPCRSPASTGRAGDRPRAPRWGPGSAVRSRSGSHWSTRSGFCP